MASLREIVTASSSRKRRNVNHIHQRKPMKWKNNTKGEKCMSGFKISMVKGYDLRTRNSELFESTKRGTLNSCSSDAEYDFDSEYEELGPLNQSKTAKPSTLLQHDQTISVEINESQISKYPDGSLKLQTPDLSKKVTNSNSFMHLNDVNELAVPHDTAEELEMDVLATTKAIENGESQTMSAKSSLGLAEKEFSKETYTIEASIQKSELLKPGEVSNIASEASGDVKIIISGIGVSTSLNNPKRASAMSSIEIIPGKRERKYPHSVVIKSILTNGNTKETNGRPPATYIIDVSKDRYTFMNYLASKEELVKMPEPTVSFKFLISISPTVQ